MTAKEEATSDPSPCPLPVGEGWLRGGQRTTLEGSWAATRPYESESSTSLQAHELGPPRTLDKTSLDPLKLSSCVLPARGSARCGSCPTLCGYERSRRCHSPTCPGPLSRHPAPAA